MSGCYQLLEARQIASCRLQLFYYHSEGGRILLRVLVVYFVSVYVIALLKCYE